MENFTKDTLFNDLPQQIKQKIMNIRNLGHPLTKTSFPTVRGFDHMAIPSSKSLNENFVKMIEAIPSKGAIEAIDATESLKSEFTEFTEFVNTYKNSINETDFISEMEKVIGLMESKYEKIARKFNIY